jgi:uncharacterized Ntn-hydrolase superfamily protein
LTYSIVARDEDTGEMGVAVQSHFFGVGRIVPWARAGVGAVATQAIADVSYGPLGLALMADGVAASDALASLIEADANSAIRQVAMVDAHGRVAAHTGDNCVAGAGHRTSRAVTAQANMMARDTVWNAMIDAYERSDGDLIDRMLQALDAAEAEGGDIRGRQSAGMLVVSGERDAAPWGQVVLDLRVEDHPEPLEELRRLVSFHRAYALVGAAVFDPRVIAGEFDASLAEVDRATQDLSLAQTILGANPEPTLWQGILLARAGRIAEARECFVMAVDATPSLMDFLRRCPEAGLLPSDPVVLHELLPPDTR